MSDHTDDAAAEGEGESTAHASRLIAQLGDGVGIDRVAMNGVAARAVFQWEPGVAGGGLGDGAHACGSARATGAWTL